MRARPQVLYTMFQDVAPIIRVVGFAIENYKMLYSEKIGLKRTDPTRWRLKTDELGRETWHYLSEAESAQSPQSNYVKHLLKVDGFPTPKPETITSPLQAAEKGADFFQLLQEPCGIFPCQYKGPMFITPGVVIANYFTKTEIPEPFRIELSRFLVNYAHPVDGGWGLHTEDKSTAFGTTMNYVVLRLLGMDADHPVLVKARKTLHRLGGALVNPHWGKSFLALLSLYEWEGVNPTPPEMWMLPYEFPIHPGRWWVHTRAIYLPLSYLAANRIQRELDPLLKAIRSEIYVQPYETIDFSKHRNTVCGVDLYYPHTKVLDVANYIIAKYEKYIRPNWLLKKTNERVYELIQKDCYNTDYLTIAPLSFAFDMMTCYVHEGPKSHAFSRYVDRMNDSIFHGPEGMTAMGTNGVQVWDVAFMIQYLFMAGLAEKPKFHDMIRRGFMFLVRSQFDSECAEGSFRDKRKGGWPFSTKTQGYTVSDCTAEALKAIIMVKNHPTFADMKDKIPDENLYMAIDLLLRLQNRASIEPGSFAAYEVIRATPLLEKLNPAEVFNNIMVEYPYVECTDSVVLGLTYFAKYYPDYKTDQVKFAIENAVKYIVSAQNPDGSWYGCWGVCFTYASMFALEAFYTVGQSYNTSKSVKLGCEFLISRQREDGGWGESMKSCETHTYVNSEKSLVVQTAWALIGLILADYPDQKPIEKGIKLLMDRQLPTGEWKFESAEGVFNHSCAIEYPSYRFLFPIKALGLYEKRYKAGLTKLYD